jgi:hypothetical protein
MPIEVKIPTEKIADEIANYMIGFAKLTVHNRVEDAVCAGSGTLAVVGRVYGVLTAAHVLDVLPEKGEVGLVSLARQRNRSARIRPQGPAQRGRQSREHLPLHRT